MICFLQCWRQHTIIITFGSSCNSYTHVLTVLKNHRLNTKSIFLVFKQPFKRPNLITKISLHTLKSSEISVFLRGGMVFKSGLKGHMLKGCILIYAGDFEAKQVHAAILIFYRQYRTQSLKYEIDK